MSVNGTLEENNDEDRAELEELMQRRSRLYQKLETREEEFRQFTLRMRDQLRAVESRLVQVLLRRAEGPGYVDLSEIGDSMPRRKAEGAGSRTDRA